MPVQTFIKRSVLGASRERAWAWHARPGAFERLNPPWDPAEVVERVGGLEVGARTVVKVRVGPAHVRMVSEHTAYDPGQLFRDEQREGPFKSWVHTHRFLDGPTGTSVLEDEIHYELPMGPLGAAVGGAPIAAKIERMFAYRHALLALDLQRHHAFANASPLTIAVTGATGLLGSALCAFLSTGGHSVKVVRRRHGNLLDVSDFEGVDAVVHLAGAPVADERWSDERKRVLVDSRVALTRQLVELLKNLRTPPKVLVSASAIGIYGDRGDEVLTETSAPGQRSNQAAGFLAGLCLDWEQEALRASAFGARVVCVRIGLVQAASGGALAKLLTPFRAGVGGPIGRGDQWQSWVGLEDVVGTIHQALLDARLNGPVNAVGPAPVTATEYAKTLGRVLHRPAVVPAPELALRAAFGELADGAILASQRVQPEALRAVGFTHVHPSLESALRFTLGR